MEQSRFDQNDVARRAYERYEQRGREDGHDQEDWFAAERDLQGRGGESSTDRLEGQRTSDMERGAGSSRAMSAAADDAMAGGRRPRGREQNP